MGKYLRAFVLLLLAAVPVILVLMLTRRDDTVSELETVDNNAEFIDSNYDNEIGYGYIEIDSSVLNNNEPQITTLTLGGLFFPKSVRIEVDRFNTENEYYQVELSVFGAIIDPYTGSLVIDYDAIGQQNFDMMFSDLGARPEYPFTPVDLYTFIDTDTELSREDFFPNVLTSLEAPDGTLPFVTYDFIIETMISKREVAEQIGLLTFENVLRTLNMPNEPSFANFGLTYDFIINRALHTSGDYFLDLENNQANFCNDDFLAVLEVAAHPPGLDMAMVGLLSILGTEWARFQRGDALLNQFWINNIEQLRRYQAILGDVVAVGIPTVTGGVHLIVPGRGIGISDGSPHQEAAWSFVRRFLLPAYIDSLNDALPLRIDIFEARIAEFSTPDIHDGAERPRELGWPGARTPLHPVPLLLYAMTEDEAAEIRGIVESAVPVLSVDRNIYVIVREEVALFMENERSAEETARTIQDRVQEFLDN